MGDPNPNPNLEKYNSTKALKEMSDEIQKSRKYFESVCDGVGVSAEGELAYTYIFTLTREGEPGFWDKVFGNDPATFDHHITNDEYHNIWVPKDGDIMPRDWASGVSGNYTSKPISNVRKILSANAEYVKQQLETARSNSDGICNMQGDDFKDIAQIASALSNQNGLLDLLIERLATADDEAQRFKENIQDNWESKSSLVYADRVDDFKNALNALGTATDEMKAANVVVVTHVGELLVAVLQIWKTRMEGMIDGIGKAIGTAQDVVSFLAKPTVMGVLLKILDVILAEVKKMATKDVNDRIKALQDLGDMAKKLEPIEKAKSTAARVTWPTMPSWDPHPK